MKKTLFLLAAAAIALVSCKPDPVEQTSNITAITMETEIAFVLDDAEDFALTVLPTPSTEQLDQTKLSFTSADEAVAVVSPEGIVTATGLGETTITAKYEELSAVCNVLVVEDAREIMTFPLGAVLQNPEGLVTNPVFALTDANGALLDSVGLALARVPIFSEGFYVDGEGYITGEGYMINAYTLVYYFVEDGSMGIYGSRKGYELLSATDNPMAKYGDCCVDDIKYYILPQGIFDVQTYGAIEEKIYLLKEEPTDEELEAYSDAMGYGDIFYIDYINEKQYVSEGHLGEGYFFEPRNESDPRHYDFTINWWNGWHGLAVTEDGTDLVRPYALAPFTVMRYTLAPAAAAPAQAPAFAPAADVKMHKMAEKPVRVKANAVTIK